MLLTRRAPLLNPRSLAAMGVLAVAVGLYGVWTNLDFLSNVARAEAEVVAVESGDPNDPFRLYRPNVVFETAAGDRMNVAAADTYRPTEAGERLVIGYDPRNPTDVRLMDPRDAWLLPLYPLIFGVVTLVIAYRRWRNPPVQPSP